MTTPKDRTRAREGQVLALRSQGRTLESIAAELGYANASGVAKALDRVLSRQAAASIDTLRVVADAELDDLQQKLYALLTLPGTNVDQAVRCIDVIRKLQERRAKLHGLDADRRLSVSVPSADAGIRPNDFNSHRGFHLVLDANAVDRRVLPWAHMVINPKPGEGTLPEPVPSIVVEPSLLPAEAIRCLIEEGGLLVGGVFFAIPTEHISDDLVDALTESGSGDGDDDGDDADGLDAV
jgi:hypothetical protein